MPSNILKSRTFWTLLLVAAAIAAVVSVRWYTTSTGLALDVSTSRTAAIEAAWQVQQQRFPDLEVDRSAAVFVTDQALQGYVELEAGGVGEYQNLIGNIDAATHYWRVRLFAEAQQPELIVALSPQGTPISYARITPQQAPGGELSEEAARVLAERGARDFIGNRFSEYALLSHDMHRQNTGRLDHEFVYEHQTLTAGEARFRLKLVVAGEELVAVDTEKFIPQAYSQRLQEMRALNNQISQISALAMAALFGFSGLAGGVWLFLRQQLLWRSAVLPAAVVATGLAVAMLCNLPTAWMNYQTTSSAGNFLFQQWVQAGGVMVVLTLFLTLVFAVAEGLTRLAMPQQVNLWSSMRPAVAGSESGAGLLLGGYAFTGLFLLYAVVFFVFTSQVLGWWSPANPQFDPNVLASARPALGPIFSSLFAGTWEECVFRAIPLSLAVLLGRRVGHARLLVAGVLVLQALVFAGMHANYPQMPGYSRVVELFLPALVFGVVFLRFGLITAILAHFLYDLVLMSMPVFAAGEGLWLDRALVIAAGLAPLAICAFARIRQGLFTQLPDTWRNEATTLSATAAAAQPQHHKPLPTFGTRAPLRLNPGWVGGGIAGALLVGWVLVQPQSIDWPAYTADRQHAVAQAEYFLAEQDVELEGDWRRTVFTRNTGSWLPRFVWENSGAEGVEQLLHSHLDTRFWVVSWRRFDGPVEERSEAWEAWLYPDGALHELKHILPEGQPGEHLSQDEAIAIAEGELQALGWPSREGLELKSVQQIDRPERTDWQVQFVDPTVYEQAGAQATLNFVVSGDQVTSYYRSLDVPEAWHREQEARNAAKTPWSTTANIILFVLVLLAATSFLRRHNGRRFSLAAAWPWMAIGAGAFFVKMVMYLPSATEHFAPTANWYIQLWMAAAGWAVSSAGTAAVLYLAAQALHGQRPVQTADSRADMLLGLCLALTFSGLWWLNAWVFADGFPDANSGYAGSLFPALTAVADALYAFVKGALLLVLALGLARFAGATWRWGVLGLLAAGWIVTGSLGAYEVDIAVGSHLLDAALLVTYMELIRRRQLGVALAMMGTKIAISWLGIANALYPHAWLHALLSCGAALIATYWLLCHWHRDSTVAVPRTATNAPMQGLPT